MTSKLDKRRPYGIIYGDPVRKYEQGGAYYDGQFNLLGTDKLLEPEVKKAEIAVTEHVESAKLFLLNILSGGPLDKAKIYKVSEQNNQAWEDVKLAAEALEVTRYKFQGIGPEMWKLKETEHGLAS